MVNDKIKTLTQYVRYETYLIAPATRSLVSYMSTDVA